jgi:hypothetical protein
MPAKPYRATRSYWLPAGNTKAKDADRNHGIG